MEKTETMGTAHSKGVVRTLATHSDPVVHEWDMMGKCDQLEVYVKPPSDHRSFAPIVGFQDASKSWRMYTRVREARGGGMVDASSSVLPSGYRVATDEERRSMRLGNYDLREKYCIDYGYIARAVLAGDILASRVVDYAKARGWCVTIDDVRKMSPGDCIEVALMDRNWMDVACESPRNESAPVFLAKNRVRFCRGSGFAGTFTPIEKDGGTFGDSMETDLHVEYAPCQFYPLNDGVLPARDEQTDRELLGSATRAEEMDPKTLVGWRGPMIRWSNVERIPRILCPS